MRTTHYLTPLKRTTIPPHHMVWDTEATQHERGGFVTHKWACGVVQGLDCKGGIWAADGVPMHAATPKELWAHISVTVDTHGALAMWAHNLAYDLRISRALEILPQLGFELDAISLAKTSTWATWTRDGAKLTMCDLWSWCPVPLDVIANDLGRPRGDFDYDNADAGELAERCEEDVETTSKAVCAILTFIEEQELGNWRPTGSGQCHAAWRRRWLPERSVLVHNDEHALQRERVAMHAGRTEAWRHGKIAGPITELDMNLAYCRIAAHLPVPGKLKFRQGAVPNARLCRLMEGYAVLADVTVETDTPLVPVTEQGRVYWPVGRFTTTLWTPELQLLMGYGVKVRVQRLWAYELTDALMGMSQWLIDCLGEHKQLIPPPVPRMLKHWARALVGRCALRFAPWDDWGTCGQSRLLLSTMVDADDGTTREHLQVGGRIFELGDMAESLSSVPQITGYVMSQARADLWALMCSVGLDRLLYVDTDGVLVQGDTSREPGGPWWVPERAVVVAKNRYGGAEIRGPRNLMVDTERRISGIPRRAVQVTDSRYDGEVWVGLESSIAHKHASEVQVQPHKWEVKSRDLRREHRPHGVTTPYRLESDDASKGNADR